MTQAEKVQLRYNYVMEASKNAAGDFANTAGSSVANQTRVAKEGVKELGINFGQLLLPAVLTVLPKINEFAGRLSSMDAETMKTVLTVAGLAAGIYPLIKAFQLIIAAVKVATAIKTGYMIATGAATVTVETSTVAQVAATAVTIAQTAATKAAAAGQWLLNAAMSANPIALIVIAVAALIAGLLYLFRNTELVQGAVKKLGEWFVLVKNKVVDFGHAAVEFFKAAVAKVLEFKEYFLLLLGPIGLIILAFMKIREHWDSIVNAIMNSKIMGVISKIGSVLGGGGGVNMPGGGVSSPIMSPAIAAASAGGSTATTTMQNNSTVNVQLPAGSTEAQKQIIEKDVKKIIAQENAKTFAKAKNNAGGVE